MLAFFVLPKIQTSDADSKSKVSNIKLKDKFWCLASGKEFLHKGQLSEILCKEYSTNILVQSGREDECLGGSVG